MSTAATAKSGPAQDGSPPPAKSPPAKATAPSPKKKSGKKPSGKDVKKKPRTVPQLIVTSFISEFPFEAYMFWADESNDHYSGFKNFANGDAPLPQLDDLGFADIKFRRRPGTRNEIYANETKGNFWRIILMRYLQQPSTAESRAEGLEAVRQFLMSTASSKWPPKEIVTKDITNVAAPHSLDMFYLDADIEKFMKTYLDEEQFTAEFFATYEDFAKKCWSGPHDSSFAKDLGFSCPLVPRSKSNRN